MNPAHRYIFGLSQALVMVVVLTGAVAGVTPATLAEEEDRPESLPKETYLASQLGYIESISECGTTGDAAERYAQHLLKTHLSAESDFDLTPGQFIQLSRIARISGDRETQKRLAEGQTSRLTAQQDHEAITLAYLAELARLLSVVKRDEEIPRVANIAAEVQRRQQATLSLEDSLDLLDVADLAHDEALRELGWNQLCRYEWAKHPVSPQQWNVLLRTARTCAAHIEESNATQAVADDLARFWAEEYFRSQANRRCISVPEWIDVLKLAGRSTDNTIRSQILALFLQDVRCESIDLSRIRHQQFIELGNASKQLSAGSADDSDALVCAWLGASTLLWHGADHAEERSQLIAAAQGDDQALQHLLAVDAHQQPATKFASAIVRAQLAMRCGRSDLANRWCEISLRLLPKDCSVPEISALAELLDAAHFTIGAEDAQGPVASIISLNAHSSEVSDRVYESLARLIESTQAEALLDRAAASPDHAVCLSAIKVMAWIHRHRGDVRPYLGRVGELMTGSEGDARAEWELARAYIASLTNESYVRRTDGNGHLRLALAAADSDEQRLRCLEELVAAGIAGGSVDSPQQVLESIVAQFGPDHQARIGVLSGRLSAFAQREKEVGSALAGTDSKKQCQQHPEPVRGNQYENK